MHVHILGICGTFMGGVALLARAAGHRVTGSDAAVYPPMSTQLEAAGMELVSGYGAEQLDSHPDCVVVGNVMRRGLPVVEALLESDLVFQSGPQWLAENILRDRWVLGVAGTHGKTTTSSMLAWILEDRGLEPGFLIGGVPANFGQSARLGRGRFFVVEADEYDTAFFDKRAKFVHYRPRTVVLNNLEFDHADIYPDLRAIQIQFHHLLRTVPGSGRIVAPGDDPHLQQVLDMGCWTPVERMLSGQWEARLLSADGSSFEILRGGQVLARVNWNQLGRHNVRNALAAVIAADHAGVPVAGAADALERFAGVRRRLELRGAAGGVRVYDDFAHHPTAIAASIDAMSRVRGEGRLLAVLEPRSNTMRMGVHRQHLAASLRGADQVFMLRPDDLAWPLEEVAAELTIPVTLADRVEDLTRTIIARARPGDHVLVMSNGGFGGIHDRLLEALGGTGSPG